MIPYASVVMNKDKSKQSEFLVSSENLWESYTRRIHESVLIHHSHGRASASSGGEANQTVNSGPSQYLCKLRG